VHLALRRPELPERRAVEAQRGAGPPAPPDGEAEPRGAAPSAGHPVEPGDAAMAPRRGEAGREQRRAQPAALPGAAAP